MADFTCQIVIKSSSMDRISDVVDRAWQGRTIETKKEWVMQNLKGYLANKVFLASNRLAKETATTEWINNNNFDITITEV